MLKYSYKTQLATELMKEKSYELDLLKNNSERIRKLLQNTRCEIVWLRKQIREGKDVGAKIV